MCKIAAITKITDATSENAWRFIKQMSKSMSVSDRDGWGYAAIDSQGGLFGERWKNPENAFAPDNLIASENATKALTKFKGMLKAKDTTPILYNSFGDITGSGSKLLRGAILHARTATSPNIMSNTHPFVTDNTALVHNGVIRNLNELVMKISSCDSETILNEYLRLGVNGDIKKIQDLGHNLQGYYACGLLAKDSNNNWIMDVFRDRGAHLAGYFIKELDCIVIATPSGSATYSDGYGYGPVVSACRTLDFTITQHYEVKEASIVRIDVMTGEPIDSMDFDSTYKEKKKDKKNKHSGNGGNKHGQRHTSYSEHGFEDVSDQWDNFFDYQQVSKEHDRRTWSDEQKEQDLDRMLTEVVTGEVQELTENRNLPAIPSHVINVQKLKESTMTTASEVLELFEQDFVMDKDTGCWHRKTGSGV